jgi:hypothetical protein
MVKADSQIAACSPSFGCAGRVDTSFHVERYRSDVTRGGFYYAHPFSFEIKICMAGRAVLTTLVALLPEKSPEGTAELIHNINFWPPIPCKAVIEQAS